MIYKNNILGHDFLKKLGRTRLRPGGGVASDWLLSQVHMDKDSKILEVAANSCDNLIRIYTKYKCKLIGIDIDKDAIKEAKEKIELLGLTNDIEIIEKNALDLDFPDESFDIVINEAMLTMLDDSDKKKALTNYHRVLKSGGYLLTHDVALDEEEEKSRQKVSQFAKINVYPLEVENWNKLFKDNKFRLLSQKTGPMLLLDRDTIIQDEGPQGAYNFYKNANKEENKNRFMTMVKKAQESNMKYIVIASRKED